MRAKDTGVKIKSNSGVKNSQLQTSTKGYKKM